MAFYIQLQPSDMGEPMNAPQLNLTPELPSIQKGLRGIFWQLPHYTGRTY